MTPFTSRVIEIIQSIPPGKVMTYGEVAIRAGNPGGARQVVRILHSMSEPHHLPWYRIVNAKGMISIKGEDAYRLQRQLLEQEGVIFDEWGAIDLKNFSWQPNKKDLFI